MTAEYVWMGGSGNDIRSKAPTLPVAVKSLSELHKSNSDGPSTSQAPGKDSKVILCPQAIFRDPFRPGNNILLHVEVPAKWLIGVRTTPM